jgi:hypothetical protein
VAPSLISTASRPDPPLIGRDASRMRRAECCGWRVRHAAGVVARAFQQVGRTSFRCRMRGCRLICGAWTYASPTAGDHAARLLVCRA